MSRLKQILMANQPLRCSPCLMIVDGTTALPLYGLGHTRFHEPSKLDSNFLPYCRNLQWLHHTVLNIQNAKEIQISISKYPTSRMFATIQVTSYGIITFCNHALRCSFVDAFPIIGASVLNPRLRVLLHRNHHFFLCGGRRLERQREIMRLPCYQLHQPAV